MIQVDDATSISVLHICATFLLVFLNVVTGVSDLMDMVTSLEPVMHTISQDEAIFALHFASSVVGVFVNISTLFLIYHVSIDSVLRFVPLSLRDTRASRGFSAFIVFNFLYIVIFLTKLQRIRYYLDFTKLNRKSSQVLQNVVEFFECCPEIYSKDHRLSIYCSFNKFEELVPCNREVNYKIVVPVFITFTSYCALLILIVAVFIANQYKLSRQESFLYDKPPRSVWSRLFQSDIRSQNQHSNFDHNNRSVDPNHNKILKCIPLKLNDSNLDVVMKNSNLIFNSQPLNIVPEYHLPNFRKDNIQGSSQK